MRYNHRKPYLADATRRSAMQAKSASVIAFCCGFDLPESTTGQHMITPGAGYGDEYEGAWVRDSVWGLEGDLGQMPLEALRSTLNKFCDLTATNGYMGDGFGYRHSYEDPYDGSPQVDYYYEVTPRGQTPLDTGFYLCVMAFLYGRKLGFDATWDAWFAANKATLDTAFAQVAYTSGLVQNTPGLWGDGQMRLKPAGVYTDTVLLRGGIVCASIVAYAAACAMADLYEIAGDSAKVSSYEAKATALKAGIRAAVLPSGWLPHTVGGHTHTNAAPSPEATAHAIAYGILTEAQALAASALFVAQYEADKAAPNGLGQIFLHATPARGGIRQLRKQDDYSVGAVFPEWLPNAPTVYGWYQNGGYWFWRSGDVAYAMQLTDPDAASEFMEAAIDDAVATAGAVWESADTDGYSGGNTGTLLLRDWGRKYLGSTTTFVASADMERYSPLVYVLSDAVSDVYDVPNRSESGFASDVGEWAVIPAPQEGVVMYLLASAVDAVWDVPPLVDSGVGVDSGRRPSVPAVPLEVPSGGAALTVVVLEG